MSLHLSSQVLPTAAPSNVSVQFRAPTTRVTPITLDSSSDDSESETEQPEPRPHSVLEISDDENPNQSVIQISDEEAPLLAPLSDQDSDSAPLPQIKSDPN